MKLEDYVSQVLLPANSAVGALRRAGIPVDIDRLESAVRSWEARLVELERDVEGAAAEAGTPFRYSASHAVASKDLANFLYRGLGLEPMKRTKTGDSTDAEALATYASLTKPRDGDHMLVWKVLKIRSLAGAIAKAAAYRDTRRADGCCHPRFNWALRTSRLSAEDPPVHQIPEHSDPDVADAMKSFMVPRLSPASHPDEWDPRKHGSVLRWDIDGAEMAIRAAMLTKLFCKEPDPAWHYVREGRDLHAHTASLIFERAESEFRKGMWERDDVAKRVGLGQQFGSGPGAVQGQIWKFARLWLDEAEVRGFCDRFDRGHPALVELCELDKAQVGRHGYVQDGYGRRRWVGVPDGVKFLGWGRDGKTRWNIPRGCGAAAARSFHVGMNTPTQSMNATDCLWMIALAYHGEYVDLRVPPMWEKKGVDFPEARSWRLHGGPGPGGKPLLAWYSNTVHDSAWGDCAPGYLEPFAKLVWRRCRAVPFDWRLEADVPYRISVSVGPDFGHLRSYSKAAKDFGLEPLE